MKVYYNEIEPFACAWLKNLMKAKQIPEGDVDTRPIQEVKADDVRTYDQCHFFAGLGGWCYALRLARCEDLRCWTGSCPCQPFSCAGKRKGESDERHLWPYFRDLAREGDAPIIFGEQVASKDGRLWLSRVRADLEEMGYGFGGADLCAAGVSAPHIRQRLFWMAVSEEQQMGLSGFSRILPGPGLGLVESNGYHEHWWSGPLQVGWNSIAGEVERSGRKYRAQWRLKPGLSIVANGIPARVGKLCAAGNAIVPQVAAEFIAASMQAISDIS